MRRPAAAILTAVAVTAVAAASPAPKGPPPAPKGLPLAAPAPSHSASCGFSASLPAVSKHATSLPWAQQVLNLPGAWQLSQGRGITVAVIDSGADAVPQLAGRVAAVNLTSARPADCDGHGTEVASIIAASRQPGTAFAGVAPQARILAIKVQNGEQSQAGQGTGLVAQAIQLAVARGARVINMSLQSSQDNPVLRSAVRYAISHRVVVVSAAGNDKIIHGKKLTGPFYPASYPGVLSVGAVASDGSPWAGTDAFSRAGVSAPGVYVTSAAPGGYVVNQLVGTSYAAPFAAGVAALILSLHPQLTPAEVVAKIDGTANGGTGPGTGAGLISPLNALTAVQLSTGPTASPQPAGPPVAVRRPPPPDRPARDTALAITAAALILAAAIVIAGLAIPAARRRRRPAGP